MSRNEHLLDNFLASDETRTLGSHILRIVQVKTGPGSGRELRELRGGLPAAAILVACERLNTTEVTTKSAQTASCLKPKDFKRVYDTVRVILEENERAITYENLHAKSKSGLQFDSLRGFITQVENEVIPGSGYEPESALARCGVYFWVLNCVEPDVLPGTEAYAQQYDLSTKSFIYMLELMNEHCKPIRRKIRSHFRKLSVSPSKPATPLRQSPRKLSARNSPSKADTLPSLPQGDPPEETPLRRSSRATVSLYGSNTSPIKSSVPLPWKKTPKRELPSKDSPRKGARDKDNVVPDDVPETPSKRRRLESPLKATDSIFPGQPGSSGSVPGQSPLKSSLFTARTKRKFGATVDVASSEDDDESDSEEPVARGRFRPVYLDHWQWVAGDPRVALIWKKAEKFKAPSFKRRFGVEVQPMNKDTAVHV